jgi:hypothetical protein
MCSIIKFNQAQEIFIRDIESPLLAFDDNVDIISTTFFEYFNSPGKRSYDNLKGVLNRSAEELQNIQTDLVKSYKLWRSQ